MMLISYFSLISNNYYICFLYSQIFYDQLQREKQYFLSEILDDFSCDHIVKKIMFDKDSI
jgi:hypothetical protein